jgi:hypothetical protein
LNIFVGEQEELERRDGALDRHLDDVDDEATSLETFELVAKRERTCRRAFAPFTIRATRTCRGCLLDDTIEPPFCRRADAKSR